MYLSVSWEVRGFADFLRKEVVLKGLESGGVVFFTGYRGRIKKHFDLALGRWLEPKKSNFAPGFAPCRTDV